MKLCSLAWELFSLCSPSITGLRALLGAFMFLTTRRQVSRFHGRPVQMLLLQQACQDCSCPVPHRLGCSTRLAEAKAWNHKGSSQYPLNHLERKMLVMPRKCGDLKWNIECRGVSYENRTSSQMVRWFLSFGGIFYVPGAKLMWVN